MSNNYVKRTTLFKVPKEEDIDAVLEQYAILRKNAVKVGRLCQCHRDFAASAWISSTCSCDP